MSASNPAPIDSSPAVRRGWVVFRAALLLPTVAILLRMRGLQFCLRLARWRLRGIETGSCDFESASRIQVLVAHANERYSLLRVDCLPLSLVGWYLSRRMGCATTLRLGVRTLTGRFESHAWIEMNGVPVGEIEDVRNIYSTMDIDRLLR